VLDPSCITLTILEHAEQNNCSIILGISGFLTWDIFLLALTSILSTIKASIIGLNCGAEDGRLFEILGNANCNTNTLSVAKVHILLNKLQ